MREQPRLESRMLAAAYCCWRELKAASEGVGIEPVVRTERALQVAALTWLAYVDTE